MRKFFTLFTAMMFAVSAMASLQSLKLVNRQLCTADNTPIQLRGWSTNDYKNFRVSCDEKADFVRMKNSGATVIASKQFRIRFKTAGQHKLALAFMTECSGLGSLKLKGMSTQAINQITNDQMRKCENMKILRDGQLFIEYNGKTYNTLGTEVN